MMLTDKDREFLLKLADLCEAYKAEFVYTNSDDGIHIQLDGKKVFRGWLLEGSAARELRSAHLDWRVGRP